MSSWRTIFLVAAVAVSLGFAAARWAQPTSRDEEILRALQRQQERSDELAARVARMQRQLQAPGESHPPDSFATGAVPVAGGPAAGAAPEAVEANAMASTPESEQALARSHQLLERSIANRTWGPSEIAEMRRLMLEMNGPAQVEIMQAVAAALNRGDIKGRISALSFE